MYEYTHKISLIGRNALNNWDLGVEAGVGPTNKTLLDRGGKPKGSPVRGLRIRSPKKALYKGMNLGFRATNYYYYHHHRHHHHH